MSTDFNLLYTLPEAKDCNPSSLALETSLFEERSFFAALLFGPIVDMGSCKYIRLGSSENIFYTDNLIIRPCYDHLLPQIHNRILAAPQGYKKTAVTGTPGIGKSVFGALLVRHYVQQKQTVLYWEKDNIYLFSFDPEVKRFFGLSVFGEKSGCGVCYAAYWNTTITRHWPEFFTRLFDIIVVHDPKAEDTRVQDNQTKIRRLIYILSHGHFLISYWNTKGGGPFRYDFMPLWSKCEAERSLPLLKRQDASLVSSDEVNKLYDKFGGCIRGWMLQGEVWGELVAKVKEVVKNCGDNVLAKNTNSRGSIIHMSVDFDEERAIAKDRDAEKISVVLTGSDDEVEEHNNFSQYRYIFGSSKILEMFNDELLNYSNETLKLCLKNWAGQSGFECVYGALFELRCHRLLENNKDGDLKLKMRVVRRDDSDNTSETRDVVFPALTGTVRYTSNDPSILLEPAFAGSVEKSKYLWPYSSNHPSYDSAVLVDGELLGLDVHVAALLLQMTVSGATGLPRRPEHAVKQHVREKFEDVFKTRIPGYQDNGSAYTAFMVPTECFEPFLFQKETYLIDNDKKTKKQPDFQLVFEVPDIFTYKRSSPKSWEPPPNDFTSKKRCHRYNDVTLSSKLEKQEDCAQLQLPEKK